MTANEIFEHILATIKIMQLFFKLQKFFKPEQALTYCNKVTHA